MLKKIFLSFLLISVIFCGCAKKEVEIDDLQQIMNRGYIIVGVKNDTAPFGFVDKKGNLSGFDIDLAKQISKVIFGDENKIHFVPVTASNRIMKLNSDEVDILIATMSITDQRRMVVRFSQPYYMAGQAIMVKKSSNVTGLKDFRGKKLIIVFGSTSERNIRTNIPNVEIIGFKTYPEAFNALKAGKADGIIADDSILMAYAYNDNSVKILPKRYSEEPYAVALKLEPENSKLLVKINYILDTMQQTGDLRKLKEKWGL